MYRLPEKVTISKCDPTGRLSLHDTPSALVEFTRRGNAAVIPSPSPRRD